MTQVPNIRTFTVCGLYIVRGSSPLDLENGSWEYDGLDHTLPAGMARIDVKQEGADDMAFACAHPGKVERMSDMRFAWDTNLVEISPEDIIEQFRPEYPEATPFTVCGILWPTGRCYSFETVTHGPVAAWRLAIADAARITNHTNRLLMAAIHPGSVPVIADQQGHKGYADPSVTNDAGMQLVLEEWKLKL